MDRPVRILCYPHFAATLTYIRIVGLVRTGGTLIYPGRDGAIEAHNHDG